MFNIRSGDQDMYGVTMDEGLRGVNKGKGETRVTRRGRGAHGAIWRRGRDLATGGVHESNTNVGQDTWLTLLTRLTRWTPYANVTHGVAMSLTS